MERLGNLFAPDQRPLMTPEQYEEWKRLNGGGAPTQITVSPPQQPPPLADAFETAALRTRQSVRPPGGRQEGKTTQVLDSLGAALYNAAAKPSRIWNALQDVPPGQPLSDNPDIVDAVAQTATDLVGLPGLTGGIPSAALGSAARDPNLWHGISKVKLPRPVSEMTATHVPTQQIVEKAITPADLQGGLLVPAIGDRSIAGTNLTGFNGYQFENPVPMQGGHGFMPAQADKGVAWASGDSVVSRLANKTRKLSEESGGKPVYFPYTAMGERSIDFSHHMSSSLAEALKGGKLTDAATRQFDKAMRAKDANFGAIKDWPGVSSANLGDYLLSAPGDVRNKLAKTMDTAKFQSLGLPSVAEARYAVTDPRLLHAPTSAAGLSVAELDPLGKVFKGVSGHSTYPAELAGQYAGGLGRSVPRDVFYPDLVNAYRKLGYEPHQYDYLMARGVKGAPEAQRANQKWVDRVSTWMEKNPKEAVNYSNATDSKTAAALAAASQSQGIRAYHGSPHDFDRFDLSKIGTGEGAQAYGHGLYFAENEGVARQYRDMLSDLKPRALEGTPDLTVPSWVAKTIESRNPIAINDIRTQFQGRLNEMRKQLADPNTMQPWLIEGNIPGIENILKAVDHYEAGAKLTPPGRMYEVNINAHPDQFLDWDKPLAQQPSVVQDLARNADLSHLQPGNRTRVMLEKFKAGEEQAHYPATGHTLHNALEDYGMKPRPELSRYLNDQGIPGIKYLDQGSRTAGQGSSNYVVFNDQLIDILRKYGIAGALALGAGGAATKWPALTDRLEQ